MSAQKPPTDLTPLDYLEQADREMAAGNGQKAAGLLWKATEGTLIALAKERGMTLGDLNAITRVLGEENPAREHFYVGNLLFAEALRDHANTDPLERYELEADVLDGFLENTREFVLVHYGRTK